VTLLLFFAWIRIAVMIFYLFFGLTPHRPRTSSGACSSPPKACRSW
jgi:hypothetical protein